VADNHRIVHTLQSVQDIAARERNVRAGVYQTETRRAKDVQNSRARQVQRAIKLGSSLLGRRSLLCPKVRLLEVLLPWLSRLRAGGTKVVAVAAHTLLIHYGVPKTVP
jgi:hypothetical protein